MAATALIHRGVSINGAGPSETYELTAEASVEIPDLAIAEDATDTEVSIAFAYAGLKWIYIKAAAALTLETNSSSAPADTISIAAAPNVFEWTYGSGITCPFTQNVTKFYFTRVGAATTVSIYAGYDATP